VEKIFKIFIKSRGVIKPHFILTGPSGSGKTFTIKQLAEVFEMNFLEVNAAQLTKEGMSGNSLSKALSPLAQFSKTKPTIIFVDEFDKLFISGNCNTDLAHESTNGVQNEFLKVLEGDTTSVFGDYGKYITIPTTSTLFIFAGAFNGEEDITLDRLRAFGLKTEFLGRVGLVYNVTPLTLEDMYGILDKSELLDNYLLLFKNMDKEKIVYELKGYIKENHNMNTIGARMINTLINQYFIKGGLPAKEVKKVTFQDKITFESDIRHQVAMGQVKCDLQEQEPEEDAV
jgi:ATP-dependent protease Clp ATPase subunit